MFFEIVIGLFGLVSCVGLGTYGMFRAVKFFKITKELKNNTTGSALLALDQAVPTASLTDINGNTTRMDVSKYTILHDRAQIDPLELFFLVGDEQEFREYIDIWLDNMNHMPSGTVSSEKAKENQDWCNQFIKYCLEYCQLHKTQYIPVKVANAMHVNGMVALVTGKDTPGVDLKDNLIIQADSPHPDPMIEWDVFFPGFEDDPTKHQPISLCSEDLYVMKPE